ncbi:MAG: hypothetical protein MUF00_19555 [Gemmatimonadaceae bacterium]|jgi:hypothetical protein|nr:hypothetical protein [Gemmatimonadaceae bacterium]
MRCHAAVLLLAPVVLVAQSPHATAEATARDSIPQRLRFARLTLGADVLALPPARTAVPGGTRGVPGQVLPRIVVGGTHFWGWSEFYVAFPLPAASIGSRGPTDAQWGPRIETGARLYAGPLAPGRLRPFAAVAMGSVSVRETRPAGEGPQITRFTVVPSLGMAWAHQQGILESGVQWLAPGRLASPIDRVTDGTFTMPRTAVWIGAKWWVETTGNPRARRDLAREADGAHALRREGVIGGPFVGLGPSSAWALRTSTHNRAVAPALPAADPYARAFEPVVGWHWPRARLSVAMPYRRFRSTNAGFGLAQSRTRESGSMELLRFVGDYRGFVPFAGPTFGVEGLTLHERDGARERMHITRRRLAPGVVLGWDIRPTRRERVVLRTNLRYTPGAFVDVPGRGRAQFAAFEFNFIQMVWHLGRAPQ